MVRKHLREREAEVWKLLFQSVAAQYWIQFCLKSVAIVGGGIVAAIGGGMEGPLFSSDLPTVKGWSILLGAGSAVGAGLILLIADRERPELMNEVKSSLEKFREYVDRYEDMVAREVWRIDCDAASQIMFEAVENLLLKPSGVIENDLQTLLDVATPSLLDALSVGYKEDYTISLYKRSEALELMVRVAHCWFDEVDAVYDQRPWAKGQGFTGQTWLKRRTIGVADANANGVRQIYEQKPEDCPQELRGLEVRPDDERYRSFLCVPIMVGAVPEPWGVLTVTSDVSGRFDDIAADSPGSDNVLVVRQAAALIALLVASETKN